MSRDSQARIAVALVAAVWLIGSAPVLLGGRTFAGEPHLAASLPWYERLASSIGDGHLPEWDDASGLGAAVALEVGRPLVYPPAWLVAALPRPWGIDAMLAAQLLLFGVGAAMWARRLGADSIAAGVAGGVAALSTAATGALAQGGAVCAAAWLPWVGWAADRLAASAGGRRAIECALVLAAVLAALLLAAGGAAGAALLAPVVAAAALVARAPRRAIAWIALAAAAGGAILLAAPAWLPAALAGRLRPGELATGAFFHPAEIPALGLALWGALAGPAQVRRLAVAGALLALIASTSLASWPDAIAAVVALDGAPIAAVALLAPLAGLGASRAAAALQRVDRLARWSAAAGALLATAALGPLAVRAWRMPLEPRELVARPPALLASSAGDAPVRRRVAWPDQPNRAYRDAPPQAGARFGFAYLPGRDRGRDPLLARMWRGSSGAAERLLDLFDVQYVVLPPSVPVPAAMRVAGQSGDRVLAENALRRSRAFVAPRWTWHADEESLLRDLFPVAPDQRTSVPLGHVRLLGTGPQSTRAPPLPEPAPPCAIASSRPEEVELTCRARAGGYAVLLDRAAPGWSAAVDGQPAAIVTADLLARAVAVGPGLHQVSFRYSTPGLRLGAALAAVAWLNAAMLALLLLRMRGRDRDGAGVGPV
ncbi:MAG TPA: hypothetical protein VNO33_10185 [Kofleriaceae bacterium]|nr:hypothetical protein [Kofleriaceae bacterium]